MNNDSLAGYFEKKLMNLRHKEELRKSATNYFRNRLSQIIRKKALDGKLPATGQVETQPLTLKPPSQMRAPTAPKTPEAPKAPQAPKAPKTPIQYPSTARSNKIAPAKPNKPKGPIGPMGPLEPIPPKPATKQQYRRQTK